MPTQCPVCKQHMLKTAMKCPNCEYVYVPEPLLNPYEAPDPECPDCGLTYSEATREAHSQR